MGRPLPGSVRNVASARTDVACTSLEVNMPHAGQLPLVDEHSDEDSFVGQALEQAERARRAAFLQRADAIAARTRGRPQVDAVALLLEDRGR